MLRFIKESELPAVLLIDDDMVSREVTATVLTMNGYTVETAEDGAGAVALLAAGSFAPGVVLMDAQMPGLSGAALIAALRAQTSAAILAISASEPAAEVIAAADGFLLKPFDSAALREALERQAPAAAPPALPDDPVLSTATLAQLRGLMTPAAVREIYAAVVSDLTARVGALEAAFAAGEREEAARIGHAIKGGCGMAGALQAARVGARIEAEMSAPGSNQVDNSGALVSELRNALANLKRMLETEFPA